MKNIFEYSRWKERSQTEMAGRMPLSGLDRSLLLPLQGERKVNIKDLDLRSPQIILFQKRMSIKRKA
jgi:hypothetical protein